MKFSIDLPVGIDRIDRESSTRGSITLFDGDTSNSPTFWFDIEGDDDVVFTHFTFDGSSEISISEYGTFLKGYTDYLVKEYSSEILYAMDV